MDTHQFKGGWQRFKQELQEKWGQLTDDDLREADGDYDKFCGMLNRKHGDCEDEIRQWTNDWYSKEEQEEILKRHATISRNQV